MEIETLTNNPDDIILMRYALDKYNIEDIRAIFEHLKQSLPNRTVIALPSDITLQILTKEEINTLINSLRQTEENL